MEPERWRLIEELYHTAREKDADLRSRFLDEACAGDVSLRREVESLLAQVEDPFPSTLTDAGNSEYKAVLSPGDRVSHFLLRESLGRGGMGMVYRAVDTRLGRTVALKLIHLERTADPLARARFLREAQVAAALDHPNICTIYEVGEHNGHLFLVMAFYKGQSLADRLKEGRIEVAEAVPLLSKIASGLAYLHEAGFVHRDIKPSNVLVTQRGEVKILDFGIAKLPEAGEEQETQIQLTKVGSMVGTIAYMSPEQAEGRRVDHRTDLWALGVVAFEMITGIPPFRGQTMSATLTRILTQDPPRPGDLVEEKLPEPLERLIAGLLQKDATKRIQDASVVVAILRQVAPLSDAPVPIAAGAPALPPGHLEASVPADGPLSWGWSPRERRTSFVGRQTEIDWLGRLAEQAASGNGGIALVGGEAGVGKTRLVEEVLTRATASGVQCMVGHCYETEGASSLVPFAEVFEQALRTMTASQLERFLGSAIMQVAKLVPDLHAIFPNMAAPIDLPTEMQRLYLFNSLFGVFEDACRTTAHILLIDDLQWADPATLLFLQHIAPRVRNLKMLIVGVYRDAEIRKGTPVAQAFEALLSQRRAERIVLARLPKNDIASLLAELSGKEPPAQLVSLFHAETEGNPFFVEEVFQHLSENGVLFAKDGRWNSELKTAGAALPESLALVISHRLGRLESTTQKMLTAAAVIGRSFDYRLLLSLCDLSEEPLLDALDDAERASLIRSLSAGAEIEYRFEHDLIRQSLFGELSPPRRQRLHLRAAEAIEATFSEDDRRRAPDLAYHLYQARALADPDKILRALTVAGQRALESAAPDEALLHFDRALGLRTNLEDRVRADLLSGRAEAHRGLGKVEETIGDWQAALGIYQALGDRLAVGNICSELSYLLIWIGKPRESMDAIQVGLATVAEEVGPQRCKLLMNLGNQEGFIGFYESAMQHHRESVEMAEQLSENRLLGCALSFECITLYCYLEIRELVEAGERARGLLEAARDPWNLANSDSFALAGWLCLGRLDEVFKRSEELDKLASGIGDLPALMLGRRWRSTGEFMAGGSLDQFQEFARADFNLLSGTGLPWICYSYYYLGFADFWFGHLDAAVENFRKAVSMEPPGAMAGVTIAGLVLAEAYGGIGEAWQSHKGMLAEPNGKLTCGQYHLASAAVEGLALRGERTEAATLYPLIQQLLDRGLVVTMLWFGLLEKLAGIAASAGGRWTEAERHFAAAAEQAERIPHRLEQIEVRRWRADMLVHRGGEGDRAEGHSLMEQVAADYRRLGMRRHLELSEEIMGRLQRDAVA